MFLSICKKFCAVILPTAIVVGSGWSAESHAGQWPFDQRQILLARPEGQTFPDDVTAAQIMDVFVKKGRIRWVTRPGAIGQLVPVEIPKDFPWRSGDAVESLGAKYKVDGILMLWTKGSEIQLNWYSTADGQPLFFETLYIPTSGATAEQGEKRKQRLTEWLLDVWSRIPGQGYVVRRDMEALEIEGADNEGFKAGDKIELIRLETMERHPVLKTLTGITSSAVGTGEVLSIGSPFSKVKLTYESDLDPVREGDRYRMIVNSPNGNSVGSLPGGHSSSTPVANDSQSTGSSQRLGEVLGIDSRFVELSVNLGYGKLSHLEVTEAADDFLISSNGYLLKLRADLLISRDWFAGFDYGQGLHSFSTLPTEYGETSLKSGLQSMRVFGAYRWIIEEGQASQGLASTELHLSGGYDRLLAKMAASSSAVAPSQKAYSGIFLGVALKMPIMESFSAKAEINRAFGTSLSEQVESSGATSKNSLWNYDFTVNYLLGPERILSLGLHNFKASSTFSGSGTRTTSGVSASINGLYGSLGYQQTF